MNNTLNTLTARVMIQKTINDRRVIAVVGAKGYVGSEICAQIKNINQFELIEIVRGDNVSDKIEKADIVIHAANSAKRFYANNYPEQDFVETVKKTHDILSLFPEKKMVLISSISARTQLDTTYGRHRRACEILADYGYNLIIRLGPMYGGDRKESTLHDIMRGRKVYLDGDTMYSYTLLEYAVKEIINKIDIDGIVEVGAKNSISLKYISDYFNTGCTFSGFNDTQIAENQNNNSPDSYDILKYCSEVWNV
jgi:nucleoside-diphosphate-sugar epimerase